jgi:hypothetical protein
LVILLCYQVYVVVPSVVDIVGKCEATDQAGHTKVYKGKQRIIIGKMGLVIGEQETSFH